MEMTDTKILELRNFISKLEITTESDLPITLLTSRERAFVNMGSLVCFNSKVTSQHKQDVLNSTLLAQAAANKQYPDREANTRQWYEFYRNVLERVGWVIVNFEYSRFDTHNSFLTVDEAVLDIIKAAASGDEYEIAEETLNAMRKLKGYDGRIVLFDQSSHNSKAGAFQVSPAAEDGTGNVTMTLGAFYFSTQSKVTNLLCFRFSANDTEFWSNSQRVTLNDQTYKAIRIDVRKKVRDLARKAVRDIEI